MFLGHVAVALAGKRVAPRVSLGTWVASVLLVDLVWPLFLLAGLEHVRIAPGITAFTPLDFHDYPITHSLAGGALWALLLAGLSRSFYRDPRALALIGAGVLSHWVLDAVAHRPDLPVLPGGPLVGLGLWQSVPATLALELAMFGAGIYLYTSTVRPRLSFWLLMAALLLAYLGAAFGPPPPDVRTLAWSAIAAWVFVAWAWWADRGNAEG